MVGNVAPGGWARRSCVSVSGESQSVCLPSPAMRAPVYGHGGARQPTSAAQREWRAESGMQLGAPTGGRLFTTPQQIRLPVAAAGASPSTAQAKMRAGRPEQVVAISHKSPRALACPAAAWHPTSPIFRARTTTRATPTRNTTPTTRRHRLCTEFVQGPPQHLAFQLLTGEDVTNTTLGPVSLSAMNVINASSLDPSDMALQHFALAPDAYV